MSVRRLAEPAVQPPSFAFSEAMSGEVTKWLAKYPAGRQQSAVIPLLMLAQEQEGWVTKAAIEHVAGMLEMPLIRVLEVATFYTQFQLKPIGTKAHLQVCGTTPCMLRGSEALMDVCREKIHPEQFHANADGTLSWEEVECLGACVNAPMVMVFKDTYEDLTPEKLGEIIDAFERGGDVTPGPQIGRVYSAPETGLTTLKDERAVLKSTRDAETHVADEAHAAEPAPVPPSRAAKPRTDAPETSAAVKSPSPVKAPASAEVDAKTVAPAINPAEANKTSAEVEGVEKQRTSKAPASPVDAPYKSPELMSGEPIGASAKASKPAARPSLDDKARPAGIERPAAPDDLQLISGVGPKIEATLHGLGIFTYRQVAAWTAAERGWVDGYLNFRGRIDRDDWVKQADALARGGEAEYVRVFGKRPR